MRLLWLLSSILLAASMLPAQVSAQSLNALRLIFPRDGAVVSGTVTVAAEATPDLEISFVVFGIDGERPMATNARPFVCSWDTRAVPDGAHLLFVEAHGPGGVVATAGPIRVIVRNEPVVAVLPGPSARWPRVSFPGHPAPGACYPPLPEPRPEVSLVLGETKVPARVCLIEDNAYVPVRPLVECLEGQALWDAQARMVTLWCRDREVQLTPGSVIGTLNGRSIRLWRPPTLDGGRTILPARTFGQILDLSVAWDAVRRVVLMGLLPAAAPTEASPGNPTPSDARKGRLASHASRMPAAACMAPEALFAMEWRWGAAGTAFRNPATSLTRTVRLRCTPHDAIRRSVFGSALPRGMCRRLYACPGGG